jgi:8-oxo-dGTP diphosphatase
MTPRPNTIENPQEMGDALVQYLLETETGHFGPGSLLLVREGEAAVLVQAGRAWAAFGPGQHTLTIDQLPGLEEAGDAFGAEIYFVNTGTRTLKWGTQGSIPFGGSAEAVRGFGEATFQVADARRFVAEMVIGQGTVQLGEVQGWLREVAHQALAQAMAGLNGPASGLAEQLGELAARARTRLQPRFESMGLALQAFEIAKLVLPDAEPVAASPYQTTGGPLSFLLNMPWTLPPEALARMMQAQNVKRALQELGLTVIEAGELPPMRYGISAAALIVHEGRLLLVRHREPEQYDFWTPPGGSLQGDESIFDCARRELREETDLNAELGRILYIQEFVEPGYHFCKFFILASSFSGTLTLANRQPGEEFLQEARFFAREELASLTVHPEILKDQFWQDRAADYPPTRYLGLERMGN